MKKECKGGSINLNDLGEGNSGIVDMGIASVTFSWLLVKGLKRGGRIWIC